ncbi:MAG: hypothetical protein [Bacteriophage sp.]|nr:MAG: hypothetical protein [Bacteriophage sp.]
MSHVEGVGYTQYLAADEVTEDNTLKLVRNVRLAILDSQLKDKIPNSTDEFQMLHQNLAELSKDAIKQKQLKADEESAKNTAELARATAEALFANMGGLNYFKQARGEPAQPIQLEALEKELPEANPVPGELHIGDDTRSFEEFNETVGKELDEKRRNGEFSLNG